MRNSSFKKIVFFKSTSSLVIPILSLISIAIYCSFPLITQAFIRYLYVQESYYVLLWVTGVFVLVYAVKYVIDVWCEKYRIKFYAKINKIVRELMFEKYKKKLPVLFEKKADLYAKHIHLFLTLVRTMMFDVFNGIKIVLLIIIIYFFDTTLFVYFLFSVPFFGLFYLVSMYMQSNTKNLGFSEPDFGNALRSASVIEDDETTTQHDNETLRGQFSKACILSR